MIVIRPCKGFEELQACVDLQVEVWGYCEGDVIPRRAFLVAQKIGGQVIGAFEERQGSGIRDQGSAEGRQGAGNREQGLAGEMVGFALALPGVKTGVRSDHGLPISYLHSHMLAVKEGYRNQSIGRRLKLAQREDALARGIKRIEWTFDPLEIKNAFLNIRKLGAVVRSYEENFYGASSSRLQGGLQTDRLVAEWWLDSPRVVAAIEGVESKWTAQSGTDGAMSIQVPAEIYAWKSEEALRPLAAAVQAENRRFFQEAFKAGLAVVGYERTERGVGIFRLGEWAEPAQ